VEAAIVLPAMVVLVLCIIQLTMVANARVMSEYAVYCAARAGIVYNADKNAMTRAAFLALLPTMGRSDSLTTAGTTLVKSIPISVEAPMRMVAGWPVVQVNIIHPTKGEASSAGISKHLGNQEVDFDDVRPAAARVNQLQLQLRYFYKMPVPFANWMLQAMWFASRGGNPMVLSGRGMNMAAPEGAIGGSYVMQARAMGASSVISAFSTGNAGVALVAAMATGKYYMPVEASYTMRMQSNLFMKNLP